MRYPNKHHSSWAGRYGSNRCCCTMATGITFNRIVWTRNSHYNPTRIGRRASFPAPLNATAVCCDVHCCIKGVKDKSHQSGCPQGWFSDKPMGRELLWPYRYSVPAFEMLPVLTIAAVLMLRASSHHVWGLPITIRAYLREKSPLSPQGRNLGAISSTQLSLGATITFSSKRTRPLHPL